MNRAEQEIVPSELSEFLPLKITRAETALSRFPIHNLAKGDSIDIRILQKDEQGESDLIWRVSPSRDFGEPRQLAYKLDTLLINRRIDEAGRPIPKVIRLGSLREICRELDLSSGKASGDVKLALQQNASAFITAKVSYKRNDGSEDRFEANFTRYGLRFFGQTLPDGKRADAVYIILNDEYWTLLNKAQFRPLDYDYLKALTPSAQRFYEIVSFRIFAALAQNRPHARLLYSEYCTRAPQQRCTDGNQMRKQMYKIHRPHLASGYLADVSYQKALSENGEEDWELRYVPGKKARAEYATFGRKRVVAGATAEGEGRQLQIESGELGSGLLQELMRRGISKTKAERLLATLKPGQPIEAQLRWTDSIIKASRAGMIRNPPGFYIHVIESNVAPPATTPTDSTRSRTQTPSAAIRDEPDPAYESYREKAFAKYIKSAQGKTEHEKFIERNRAQVARAFPSFVPEFVEQVATAAARTAIFEKLKLLSADEFAASKSAA